MRLVKTLFKCSFFALIISILVYIGVYAYAKITPKLEIKSANSLSLYDNTNNIYFQGTGSKEWVSLDNISPYLIQATIATEDKNFYQHKGFDFLRIIKASFINIKNKAMVQGASTITQQYAKNLFLSFEKTWARKWDEMWLTIEIESHYTKDEILEGYLNTINYGHGMYGIENAAQYYFNKNASDLTLGEASILTVIPKAPAYYSPIVNFDLAKKRQKMILNNMLTNKMITQKDADLAFNENLIIFGKKDLINLTTIMYYKDAVLEELETINNIPNSFLETGGLKIYTNLDVDLQKKMEETINSTIPSDNKLQVATMMMNPNNGKVLALAGGKDYNLSQFNRAVTAKRQVGSTMKPFLYYAALENGFTSSTSFTSEETTFTFSNNNSYSPKNAGEKYGNKPISMATAISYSENIYAVKTHMFLGENALIDIANRLGINSRLEAVPSLPLGTCEISMIEMIGAYAAFANEGYKIKPHFINRIEDINGNILYSYDGVKENILNKSLTFILNNLLTSTYDSDFIDYNYPTAININSRLTHKYALKSGTTNTDQWYIGYNKDIVTAVWIGYDDNQEVLINDYKYSQNIWVELMEYYNKNSDDAWYQMPNNVVGVLVNPINGLPITDGDKKKKIMYYIRGSEPALDDPVFDEIIQ